MDEPATSPYFIHRWSDQRNREALVTGIDAVFFDSAGIKTFADDAARAAFRERWLGRYLRHDPDWAYVAIDASGQVAGYLVGCLDDPAITPRFADIGYFRVFAPQTARFPAHLHVNLAAAVRGAGLGSLLVGRFMADAARAGALGVHIVTGRGLRNVGFYMRNGFAEVAATPWNGREVVMLARTLSV